MGPGAEAGIDAAAGSAHEAQAMNEPAALTSPAAAGLLVLPPVTDVFRDDELDLPATPCSRSRPQGRRLPGHGGRLTARLRAGALVPRRVVQLP